jgi:hypothetical protein
MIVVFLFGAVMFGGGIFLCLVLGLFSYGETREENAKHGKVGKTLNKYHRGK